jgi:hypothetical protein
MTSRAEGRRYWLAYSAAAWALIFAAFHFIWAAGWYPLLDADKARAAFAVPWKWWYDVVAGLLCVVAVPVALAPVVEPLRRTSPRLLFALAAIGTSVLAIRAVASLIQTAYLTVRGFNADQFWPWEPWFYVGAALFCAVTWNWHVSRRRAA